MLAIAKRFNTKCTASTSVVHTHAVYTNKCLRTVYHKHTYTHVYTPEELWARHSLHTHRTNRASKLEMCPPSNNASRVFRHTRGVWIQDAACMRAEYFWAVSLAGSGEKEGTCCWGGGG